MYESITYAEIKKLPIQQKTEAWKELKSLYKTQRELAEKLGVTPGLVYNMISRYVKEESVEYKKPVIIEKPKRVRNKVKKQDKQEQVKEPEYIPAEINTAVPKKNTFSIFINKTVTGEAASIFLNGIGSTLLEGQKYTVEIKITEE